MRDLLGERTGVFVNPGCLGFRGENGKEYQTKCELWMLKPRKGSTQLFSSPLFAGFVTLCNQIKTQVRSKDGPTLTYHFQINCWGERKESSQKLRFYIIKSWFSSRNGEAVVRLCLYVISEAIWTEHHEKTFALICTQSICAASLYIWLSKWRRKNRPGK